MNHGSLSFGSALGVALAAARAAPAAAHPGHGATTVGWLHYVASPEHAVPLALVALAIAVGLARLAWIERRKLQHPS